MHKKQRTFVCKDAHKMHNAHETHNAQKPNKPYKTPGAIIAFIIIITVLFGCAGNIFSANALSANALSANALTANALPPADSSAALPFDSFRDIPGMTADDIKRVEAVLAAHVSFTYGMTPSSEAFYNDSGRVSGFSSLVAAWLTALFDVKFVPIIRDWDDLAAGLDSCEIDFVGNLTISAERQQKYFMTNAISRRGIKYMMLVGSRLPDDISATRVVRYGFLDGSTTYGIVADLIPVEYEPVFVSNYKEAHKLLLSGEIDAFLAEGTNEAAFDEYGDVVTSSFYPPIYSPIAITTANPELAPIIDAFQRVLDNGGSRYLAELHSLGEETYKAHKFSMMLTDEEREYIRNNPVIYFAGEPGNYPLSFYNARDNAWQGIAIETLEEISSISGLKFELVNDEKANWSDLLSLLDSGKASMITELIKTHERENEYLWPNTAFVTDNLALISKSDFRNININEIGYVKLGVVEGTAFSELCNEWFPNHSFLTEYGSTLAAFDALDRGEVDMVMTSRAKLLMLTHYMERVDFKTNFLFDYPISSTYGFSKDETLLCSIIDKALYLIDTELISSTWLHKTYDYRSNVAEAQLPWLIGAAVMLVCALSLFFVIIYRKNNEGRRLAILVEEQTEEARKALRAKSEFLANMNHEIRTPVNVIVGLTEILLEEDSQIENPREYLQKINTAGTTLMDLINDILDISKIESGKIALTPSDYEVPSMLNDVVTLNTIRFVEKPIVFTLEISDNVNTMLNGDNLYVKQILNNLLSNAFKYTREGSVTLKVRAEREDEKTVKLMFSISDTGIGIRNDEKERIFQTYYQGDVRANHEIEGTGLGLSITKKLIELMGGEITLESTYGKGSTFYVMIRQGFVSDSVITPETTDSLRSFQFAEVKQATQKQERPDLSWAKVLVVDDYSANIDVTKGLLAKYKIKADGVLSGQEAIDLIKLGQPVYDVIFMDHMMPGMDGVEATRRIRRIDSDYARKVPIVAFTANTVAGNEKMFLANGFQAFLPKPLSLKNLDVAVRRWIMKNPTLRESYAAADASAADASAAGNGVAGNGAAVAAPPRAPAPAPAPTPTLAVSVQPPSAVSPAPTVSAKSVPTAPAPASPAGYANIPGVNAQLGLSLYDDDDELYTDILRAFAENITAELDKLRNPTTAALRSYAIDIHTVKGSSAGIGAKAISGRAKELEDMAKNNDLAGILARNDEFIKDTLQLVSDIRNALELTDN